MRKGSAVTRVAVLAILALALSLGAFAATVSSRSVARLSTRKSTSLTERPRAQKRMSRMRHSRRLARARVTTRVSRSRRQRYYERFYTSSFASDITEGDLTAGEDPVVRQAAIDAVGNMNGTVVAIDPGSGRVLAMVNQKLALSAGATPCSTIKVPVALAALSEGLITKETKVPLTRTYRMDLTNALAHS